MSQETPKERETFSKEKTNQQKSIDLSKLAEKIIALLLREIETESERLGR